MAGQDVEKETMTLEKEVHRDPLSNEEEYECEFSPAEQKKIIRRIDYRLIIPIGALYCMTLIDRGNLGAASIAGMNKDLELNVLHGHVSRYSIVTLVFFTTYVAFQPPATATVRYLGPRNFLSFIVVSWGAVMIGMGFVQNYEALAGLRVVLGMLEAGFFPSCVYLLSTWYTRYDVGTRYSAFVIIANLAAACAGILAYGLMQLGGREGLAGWRWIFIVEGVLTCFLGIVGYWAIVDFPDKAHTSWHFLNEREAKFIIDRVDKDRGDAQPEPWSFVKFFRGGADWKVWGYALIFFNTTTVGYAFGYFLPIIFRDNLGFSVAASQCLVTPPSFTAALVTFAFAYLGDKYRIRGPFIVLGTLCSVIGIPLLGFQENNGAKLFGIFLVSAGQHANVPTIMAYQANNIRGQWKRAFCSATLVGAGGLGGIAGSLIFRRQDAPYFHPGLYACLACCLFNLILVGLINLSSWRSNQKADRGEVELEYYDETDQKGFRYTY